MNYVCDNCYKEFYTNKKDTFTNSKRVGTTIIVFCSKKCFEEYKRRERLYKLYDIEKRTK